MVGPGGRRRIGVVGAGVSGLSAAWLLSRTCEVTLIEAEARLGGHANTVAVPRPDGGSDAVDAGFIVYNEATYPNLTALFAHLGVATRASDMSFSVSMDGGRLEYGSSDLRAIFAQKRNLVSPRFWGLLADLARFYREAPRALAGLDETTTLGELLARGGYGEAFRRGHILPQAAAIWSSSLADIEAYPAAAFLRFFVNHGLLELDVNARPQWRTVVGGSAAYPPRLLTGLEGRVIAGRPAAAVRRRADGVDVRLADGETLGFDALVLAVHAPDALRLLEAPTPAERALLSAIRYRRNLAILHSDPALMPRRRGAWSAWNFMGDGAGGAEIAYWMNRLQGLPEAVPYIVTLNPRRPPRPDLEIRRFDYAHPVFDAPALAAQRRLWSLQGEGGVWYCGAWFGAGFHEDGLQAGLAVAEALGAPGRPWRVADPSGRIHLPPGAAAA